MFSRIRVRRGGGAQAYQVGPIFAAMMYFLLHAIIATLPVIYATTLLLFRVGAFELWPVNVSDVTPLLPRAALIAEEQRKIAEEVERERKRLERERLA